ncbi:unnamed protein product [Rotaria socialis]|uniref:SAM domain-containing protein n=1 Tax=Rotaria socialis TaxID=392032 RepID=A0A818LYV4_9BILA|nr:unnamed protein product [Rotaria socialis]CAF3459178.1 unnamed protein product [Rotaria socialis]CAF3581423.1 unnamed protein product [Rotaria socialis]CAF4108535.1 unnamed protein product [Rotaria socialis]CAF4537331.1 unnamed protein product [Rotaria socialis]
MKISDCTTTSTLLIQSSLLLKTNKSTKPFKFNRRLKNRMNTLAKNSLPNTMRMNNHQFAPMSSLWANTQVTSPDSTVTPINSSPPLINTYPLSVITPSSINLQQQQNTSMFSSSKSFTAPRVTTTLVPLNVCPTECCQPVKATLIPSVNVIEDYHEQKSTKTVTTHLIGDWIIRESSEPFKRKENERTAPIARIVQREKIIVADETPTTYSLSLSPVRQWTTDNVCSFFEHVLGKNCYTPIIKEHLIDGTALLLLEDEHLTTIFKMQLGPRLKLLNRIDKLKIDGDLSTH